MKNEHNTPERNTTQSGVQEKVLGYAKRVRLRKIVAVFCVVVMLFTINSLKFEGVSLEHTATCGFEEHVHDTSCYDEEGELICGLPEHTHTDACYQERPKPEPTVFDEYADLDSQVVLSSPMDDDDEEVSAANVDETVGEVEADLTDSSSEGDDGLSADYDAVGADAGFDDAEPLQYEYAINGNVAFLGDIMNVAGVGVSNISSVGELKDNDVNAVGEYIAVESVEGVENEYVIKVTKSFDRVELCIVGDEIVSIWLLNGVAVAPIEAADDTTVGDDTAVEEDGAVSEDALVVEDSGVVSEDAQVIDKSEQEGNENETGDNESKITETEPKQTKVETKQTEVGGNVIAAPTEGETMVDESTADENTADDTATDAQNAGGDTTVDDSVTGETAIDENADDETATNETATGDTVTDETATGDTVTGEDTADEDNVGEHAAGENDVADTADGIGPMRVALDFTHYSIADEHMAFLYDGEMKAVLVKIDEIASVDGVEVTLPESAAEEEAANDEAANDEAEDDTLIITGDGAYEAGRTLYVVSGLVLEEAVSAEGSADEAPANEAPADESGEAYAVETPAEEPASEAPAAPSLVELDFANYTATDDHTAFLYDSAEVAVKVRVSDIASVDGVEAAMPAEEAPDGEETQGEPATLVIMDNGEYELDGVIYAVRNLVLPVARVENDDITISTSNEEATFLNVEPVFEETEENYDDIFSLFTAAQDDPTLIAKLADALFGVAYAEEAETRTLQMKLFNIGLQDAETGEEVEPGTEVHIETSFDGIRGEDFKLYHIVDGQAELVEDAVVVENGEAVGFDFFIDSLSPFALVYYTVDFYYDEEEVSIEGDTQVLLSALIEKLGITDENGELIDVANVVSVSFSDERLVAVEAVSGQVEVNGKAVDVGGKDFLLTSKKPFTSWEKLILTMKNGDEIVVDVIDAMDTTSPWDLANPDNTNYLTVYAENTVTQTELDRTAIFKLTFVYSLTDTVVHAIDAYEGEPVLVYDMSSFASQVPGGIKNSSNGVISIGTRRLGTYVIQNNQAILTFTDTSYFDGCSEFEGFFNITVQTDESMVNESGEYEFSFPGTTDVIPIHYTKSVENGTKSVYAVKDANGNYTLHYTANVKVNADLDSLTFNDTLGGLQTLDASSVKINNTPVTVSQNGQNFSFDVAAALGTTGVAKGNYQVTYDTTVTEQQLKAMQADKTTETNKVTWRVNGTKDVPGGETKIEIPKPMDPIPVEKKVSTTTGTPGSSITYNVTYGDANTVLSDFHISDYITDVVIPQGTAVTLNYNGQSVQVPYGSQATDTSYSRNEVTLFDYTFPQGTQGNGPVTATYTVQLIDSDTAKANGVYDTTSVHNMALEHRQNTSDDTRTTVTYEKEPHYDVLKTASYTQNPDGKAEPGTYITYTLTVGDANTNMAGVNIRDFMTDLQVLSGDIMIQVGNGAQMRLADYVWYAIKWTDDNSYSANDVLLFNFDMPSDAGNGPVVITYTTRIVDGNAAANANIFGERDIRNTGSGGKQSETTHVPTVFEDYPIDKTVTQNSIDVDGDTLNMGDIVHYTMTLGKPGMDLGNSLIEDWMTDLQKLTSPITITRADGTSFIMPTSSGLNAENGNRWTWLNDDKYSTGEICLFKYRLPADIGVGPITIEYDCEIISEDEAMENSIGDTKEVKNSFRHNGHNADSHVYIEFPKDPRKEPDIWKEFCEYDLANSIVYWNIIVGKTDDSAYPLENVVVREKFTDIHITEPSQGYNNNGTFNGSHFDSLHAIVTTDDGTVLTPGVDYTVDKTKAQFTFPVLRERVTIKLAFLSPAKIVDGYMVINTAELVTPNKAVAADWEYHQPQLSMYKNGAATEDDRIIKWQVIINPSKKEYTDSNPIRVWFKDSIPEGLTLLNYDTKSEGTPSIDVKIEGILWYEHTIPVTVDSSTNEIQKVDIAAHGYWSNSNNHAGLNGNKFIVTYYTKISDEEWDRITSSASGVGTFENHAEITAGNDEHFEATDTVYVTSDEYITKTDSTKKDPAGLVVDDMGNTTKAITYTVEINPHSYLLNSNQPLSLTDRIDTNMDLAPETVKVYTATMGTNGKLVSTGIEQTGLDISYNDDSRLLSVKNIPDKTPLLMVYSCYARAQGQGEFRNTVTLIGGGSHSSTTTQQHVIQTNDAGVKIEGILMNMHKIDENNISKDLAGAKFQLYKCNLAIGDLTSDTNYPQSYWDNLLEMMDRINAGNGTAAEIEQVMAQFKIDSYECVGEPAITGASGFTQWTGLHENVLYAWKEVEAPPEYTGYEGYHYFVGYQHIDLNSDKVPQPLLPESEQINRKHAAWALDDACQLANGIQVASMSNLTTWTATNVETKYTSISATKEWENDSDNLFETRPTNGIRLQLWQIPERNGDAVPYGAPVAINADSEGNWPTYIWNKLPANSAEHGNYKYTVVEEKVDNYTTTYSDNGEGLFKGVITVTNRMIPKNTNIYVKKVFDPIDCDKPNSIKVYLMVIMTNKKTGEVSEPEEVYEGELNSFNNWSINWKGLPTTKVVIQPDGTKVGYDLTYTVYEDTQQLARDGFGDYVVSYSDNNQGVVETTEDNPLVITNSKPKNGSLEIKKTVTVGGQQQVNPGVNLISMLEGPYEFIVVKKDDQTVTRTVTITVTDGKANTALVEDLPAGEYIITETTPTNGTTLANDNSKTVTVTAGKKTSAELLDTAKAEFINNMPTTSVTATKVWKDGDKTIAWPEDVEKVEFTLYRMAGGATEEVVSTDLTEFWTQTELAGFSNPVTVDANNPTASWDKLPTRVLLNGAWTDATYAVKETKIIYTGGSGKTNLISSEDITAAYGAVWDETDKTITNTLTTHISATKVWQNADGTANADGWSVAVGETTYKYRVKAKLSRSISGGKDETVYSDVVITGTATAGLEATADGEHMAGTYDWLNLPAYDVNGKAYTYKVEETAVEVSTDGGTNWTTANNAAFTKYYAATGNNLADGTITNSGTVTITNRPAVLELDVTKDWTNFYDILPKDYKVRVTYIGHVGTLIGETITEIFEPAEILSKIASKAVVYEWDSTAKALVVPSNAELQPVWRNLSRYSLDGSVEYRYWVTEELVELVPESGSAIVIHNPTGQSPVTLFTVTGNTPADATLNNETGKIGQALTNIVPKTSFTADKSWLKFKTDGTTEEIPTDDIPAGTQIVFRLAQYKGEIEVNTFAVQSVILDGDVDARITLMVSDTSTTESDYSGNEAEAWKYTWSNLPKHYWVEPVTAGGTTTPGSFQEYTYKVEEVSVKWGANGTVQTVTDGKTSAGKFLVTVKPNQPDTTKATVINTLNEKDVEFGKQWKDPNGTPQRWVKDGENNAAITIRFTRVRQTSSADSSEYTDESFTKTFVIRQGDATMTSTDKDENDQVTFNLTWLDMAEPTGAVAPTDYIYRFRITGLEKYYRDGDWQTEWYYQISETQSPSINGKLFNEPGYSVKQTYAGEDEYIINCEDAGVSLPATGGPGTTLFYVLGSTLTLLALAMLLRRKEE